MINLNLELVIEYFIIPLFFSVVSIMLYVSYRYSYSCQSCGTYLRNRNKVIKCRFCSMNLCPRCKTKGFCPRCSRALTKEQKTKISRPYTYFRLSVLIVFLILALIGLSAFSIRNYRVIGFVVGFFVVYIIVGAIAYRIWVKSAIKAVKNERLRGITNNSTFGRAPINPKDILAILSENINRCTNCGKTLETSIKFCPDCGTKTY